ncbi:MAG: hypothetical protein Q8O87_02945 [bacterium]|nr:hypothetical protein [bacterium]
MGIYFTAKHSARFVVMFPKIITTFAKFIKQVFIYIHSGEQTVACVYGAIFATVGFFLGSAIVGALVGYAVSRVSLELISVRWLKLVNGRA